MIEINSTENAVITDCVFDGASGLYGKSRGYIIFRPAVYGVTIKSNAFISAQADASPNYGIIFENPDEAKLTA